jgi:hypothetical protein
MSDPVELYVTETQTVEVSVSESQSDLLASYDPAPTELTVLDAPGAQITIESGGGGGSLSSLDDVNITPPAPAPEPGQALVFAGQDWIAGPEICLISITPPTDSTLLISGGKANASTVFTDESVTGAQLSASGGGVYYTSTVTHFSQNSIFFDGSSYILVEDTIGTSFDANEDFTVRAWLYQTDNDSYQTIISWNDDLYEGLYVYDGYLWWYEWQEDYTSVLLPLNQWNYVVVSRKGNQLFIYLNGDLISTTSGVGQYFYSGEAAIGINGDRADEFFKGNIAEIQFVRGTALYHTVPSIPVPISPFNALTESVRQISYSINSLDDVDTSTIAPTNKQALIYDSTTEKWRPGDNFPKQQTIAVTTFSLAAGDTEDFSITAGSLLNLLSITASTPSWVRVYGTAAARSADLRTSPGGVPPLAGGEFYAEVATTASPQTIRFSPVPLVQGTAGEVFVRVANTDTVARTIVLSFSVLTLQA